MQYTSWLKWGVIVGVCLSLFTVFIVADGIHFPANMFFPYITGKNFTFRVLVEIIFALYVILAIREPKFRPRSSLLMWSFTLFIVWMGLATITSVDPIKSFWSNFERMDGYINLIHVYLLFVVAGAVITAQRWWERLFQISICASMFMGVYALFEVFHLFGLSPSSQSGPRADTTFGNATYLAVYMLFNIFITLFLLIRDRKDPVMRWFYIVALVLQVPSLYFTQTRGAILGLVGGLIVAGVYIALWGTGAPWRRLRTISIWGVGIIAVLVLAFVTLKNTPLIQNHETLQRFAAISLTDRTTTSRLTIWSEALKGFEEKPILGWGQENFSYVFNKYFDPAMYDQEAWFDRAHNEFIDWLTTGGLPAFLLYVSLFLFAIWAIWRSDLEVPEQAVLIGLLAGYAFNNLLVFDNLGSYLYFALILAFIHGISREKLPGWMFMSKPLDDRAVAVAAPIVLVLLIWGGWVLNAGGIARAQTLIDALTPYNQQTGAAKDPKDNLASFQQALADGPLGYQETVEQLFQFTSNAVQSGSPEVKQLAYTQTRQAGDSLLAMRPGDARLELFYGVFLNQYGQYAEALQHMNAALAASPKKQQILLEIGATDLAAGHANDALIPLKQAFDETPQDDQARAFYAAGLIYAGQNAQADKLLNDGFGTVLVDDPQIMQVYFSTKQYGKLAGIYALRLTKNPNDAQALVGHAITSYFATGNKTTAIAELQKAITSNPNLASQIQSFITQINNGTLKP